MPFTGPLFKFALFQTRRDEFYWFTCCHHIVIDASGIALVGLRIATIYSAIVSGAPMPPAFFGSLEDLISSESEYEASTDYLEDQAYWTENLPSESGSDHRFPKPRASVVRIVLLRRFNWTLWSFAEFNELSELVEHASVIGHHRGVRTVGARVVRRRLGGGTRLSGK